MLTESGWGLPFGDDPGHIVMCPEPQAEYVATYLDLELTLESRLRAVVAGLVMMLAITPATCVLLPEIAVSVEVSLIGGVLLLIFLMIRAYLAFSGHQCDYHNKLRRWHEEALIKWGGECDE